jgi:SAM-dependent methyltransferase
MTPPVLHILALALCEDDLRGVRACIGRSLRREGRTLDLGCGPGLFADLFSDGDYVGIDPRATFVQYARRHRPGAFLCEALARTGLPAGRFDQAIALDALGPRDDAAGRAILAELRRLVVPGGRALFIERADAAERVARLVPTLGRIEKREEMRSGYRRRVVTHVGPHVG